nr:unnamed protein product [Callosobruchus chinensis]
MVGGVGGATAAAQVVPRMRVKPRSKGVAPAVQRKNIADLNRRITDLKMEGGATVPTSTAKPTTQFTELQQRLQPSTAVQAQLRRDSSSTVSSYYGSMRSADAASRKSSLASQVSRPGIQTTGQGSFYDPISVGSSRRSSQLSTTTTGGTSIPPPPPSHLLAGQLQKLQATAVPSGMTSNLVLQTQAASLQHTAMQQSWLSNTLTNLTTASSEARRMSEPTHTMTDRKSPPPRPASVTLSPLKGTMNSSEIHPNQAVVLDEVGEGEMVENKLVIPDEMVRYLNQVADNQTGEVTNMSWSGNNDTSNRNTTQKPLESPSSFGILPSPSNLNQMIPSPSNINQMIPSPASLNQIMPSPSSLSQMVPSPSNTNHIHSQMVPTSSNANQMLASPAANLNQMMPSPASNGNQMMPSPAANLNQMMPSPAANISQMMPSPAANMNQMMPSPVANMNQMMPSPASNMNQMMASPSANMSTMINSPPSVMNQMMPSPANLNQMMPSPAPSNLNQMSPAPNMNQMIASPPSNYQVMQSPPSTYSMLSPAPSMNQMVQSPGMGCQQVMSPGMQAMNQIHGNQMMMQHPQMNNNCYARQPMPQGGCYNIPQHWNNCQTMSNMLPQQDNHPMCNRNQDYQGQNRQVVGNNYPMQQQSCGTHNYQNQNGYMNCQNKGNGCYKNCQPYQASQGAGYNCMPNTSEPLPSPAIATPAPSDTVNHPQQAQMSRPCSTHYAPNCYPTPPYTNQCIPNPQKCNNCQNCNGFNQQKISEQCKENQPQGSPGVASQTLLGMRQDAYQRTLEYVQNCQSWVNSSEVANSTHTLKCGDKPTSNMVVNDMTSSLSSLLEENRYLQMIQ